VVAETDGIAARLLEGAVDNRNSLCVLHKQSAAAVDGPAQQNTVGATGFGELVMEGISDIHVRAREKWCTPLPSMRHQSPPLGTS